MLSKETFCEALRKIQAQKDRDEQFSKALTLMGDGHFVFEGGAPLLAALLDVLKEAVNDQYDYISWWLYDRVLVMNGDRLARDAEGLAAIGEKLTAAGIRVYCPDGEIDLAPAYSHGYFRVATMEQTM